MKTLPKGTMHHLHFDCNEDPEFVPFLIFSIKNTLSMIRESSSVRIKTLLRWVPKKKQKLRAGSPWNP
jgi:hypothetical protein